LAFLFNCTCHDGFNAAVSLAAFTGVVVRDRFTFAFADHRDTVALNTVIHEQLTGGLGTALGEILVVLFRSDAAGVAFQRYGSGRVLFHKARRRYQVSTVAGADGGI